MSLVIAAFDSQRGILCSEGRVTMTDPAGKVYTRREDFWKHLQVDDWTAFAAAGAGELVIPALQIARDVGESFRGRSADLAGGLVDFFSRFVSRAPLKLPDSPIPIAIVILSKNHTTGNVVCSLLASDRQLQTFHVAPGADAQLLILSPCDPTSFFLRERLGGALAKIFKRNTGASFVREAQASIRAAVADAAKKDPRINTDARFAVIGGPGGLEKENREACPASPLQHGAQMYVSSIMASARGALERLRCYVGSVRTPPDGGPDTVGNDDGGAAAQVGTTLVVGFDNNAQSSYSGNGVLIDVDKTNDRDMMTYGEGTVTGNGSGVNLVMFNLRISFDVALALTPSLKLKVRSSFPTNSLNGTGDVGKIEYSIDGSTFTTIATVTPGQTRGVTVDSVDLPGSQPLHRIILMMTVRTFVSQTSGTLTGRLYGAWLEAA